MSEETQLKKAREHLSNKAYAKAWDVLAQIPDNPQARTWMNKLIGAKAQLAARPAKNTEAALKKARQHIADKKFADAWAILSGIPDDTTARKWMRQLLSKSELNLADAGGAGGAGGRRALMLLLGIVVIVAVGVVSILLQQQNTRTTPGGAGAAQPNLPQALALNRPEGTFTLYYPAGWVARQMEEGTIGFATSEDALSSIMTDAPPSEGELVGQLVEFFTPEVLGFLDLPEDGGPAAVLNLFLGFMEGDEGGELSMGTPEAFSANNKNGAMAMGRVTVEDASYDALIMVVEVGEFVPVFVIGTSEGQIEQYKPLLREMAGAFEFVPVGAEAAATQEADAATTQEADAATTQEAEAAATQEAAAPADANLPQVLTVDRPNGTLTLRYPAGWATNLGEFGDITLSNSPEALNIIDSGNPPGPGQLGGVVMEVVGMEMLIAMGAGNRPAEVARAFAQVMSSQGMFDIEANFGSVQSFTATGKEGATLIGTSAIEGTDVEMVVIVVDEGDSLIVLFFAGLQGEVSPFVGQLQEIAGAVSFTPFESEE